MRKATSHMQRFYVSTIVTIFLILAVSFLFTPGNTSAQSLVTTEFQVTNSEGLDTTPTLGYDGATGLVVYTSFPSFPDGSWGLGKVYYQRLSTTSPMGAPVLVSDSPYNDKLNDVSGDHIVYTSFEDPAQVSGQIKLYKISSGATRSVSGWAAVREARIFGSRIAWIQGAPGETTVVTIDIKDIGISVPQLIAGPLPATSHVEIGDRFIVWEERDGGQGDIRAYDPVSGAYYEISTDPTIDDSEPSTYGPWITWQSYDGTSASTLIKTLNADTGELRTVVDNGAYNRYPTMDGDFICWEGNASGNFDIYLYRISTGETYQLTDDPADQILNNIFGDQVAYSDNRNGNDEIYVATFAENQPPVSILVPDHIEGLAPLDISFNGSSSYDPEGMAITYHWDFGDGSAPSTNPNPRHVYDNEGIYTVTLTVTDELGALSSDSLTVTVWPNCLTVLPLWYDFGDVEVGSVSTQIFTFSNDCVPNGIPILVQLDTAANPPFSITQAPSFPVTIPLNETVEVEITFAPQTAGAYSGWLFYGSLFPYTGNNTWYGFTVSGNGVETEPPADTVAEVLDFFDTSVIDGTLLGNGNGNSASGRRNALRNMIEASDDLVAAGDFVGACQQLMDAYKRTDGEPKPPDFVSGASATDLAASLITLMSDLGCP